MGEDQLIWPPLFFWHIYCQEGIPTDNGNSNQDTNYNTDQRKIWKHLWNVGSNGNNTTGNWEGNHKHDDSNQG